jgi:hypothetical protein
MDKIEYVHSRSVEGGVPGGRLFICEACQGMATKTLNS